MNPNRKKLVALFFISLLAVDEAAKIQTTATATVFALTVLRAVGMRISLSDSMKGPDVVLNGVATTVTDLNTGADHKLVCDQDVIVQLNDGSKDTLGFRLYADQYRNAGRPVPIALKGQEGQACTEFYSIECVASSEPPHHAVVRWEHRKAYGCKDWLTGMNANGTWDTEFGSILNRYQEVRVNPVIGNEKIVGSRYVPQFPEGTKYFSATPAPAGDCTALKSRMEAAEKELSDVVTGTCQSTNAPESEDVAGSCQRGETPPLDKFANYVNSFQSARAAYQVARCETSSPEPAEDMMNSPVIQSVKDMYVKMQSKTMSTDAAEANINNVIGSLSRFAEKCRDNGDCMPASSEVTSSLDNLLFGASEGDQKLPEESVDRSHLARLAEDLEEHPGRAEALMKQSMSSLMQSASDVNDGNFSSLLESSEDMMMSFGEILAWAAGIALALFLVYLVVVLICAIVVFIAGNILTILAILGIAFLVMFGLLVVLCGGWRNISNEAFACKGSRGERQAQYKRLGITFKNGIRWT